MTVLSMSFTGRPPLATNQGLGCSIRHQHVGSALSNGRDARFVSTQIANLRRVAAAPWTAFQARLYGQGSRFSGRDPDALALLGVPIGTPLFDGGSQTSTTLATNGWTPSTGAILRAGDCIVFDSTSSGTPRMVIADVGSYGSGTATLTLGTPLRERPSGDAAIITTQATCIMMLADDRVDWDTDRVSLYGITFGGIEAYGA